MFDLLIKNIGMLATPVGCAPKKSAQHGEICIIKNATIGIKNGVIEYVDSLEETSRQVQDNVGSHHHGLEKWQSVQAGREMVAMLAVPGASTSHFDLGTPAVSRQTIDAGGRLVTPGLVDAHTHLVFGGFRQNELAAKLAGADYLDILKAGGGILSTVEATRSTSYDALLQKSRGFLDNMLAHGTTTVEAKSGYGLDFETELNQLRITNELNKTHPMDIVSTFMGAHTIPKEYKTNPQDYVALLIDKIIPGMKGYAKFFDIFCESGVFDIRTSRKILQAAKAYGFIPKLHGDEVTPMGAAALAAELGCISAEHLIEAADDGLHAMAEANTIAVLLPGTSFYLNKNYARARDMLKMGIAVALGSDFNPGSNPCYNMQFVLTLACLKLKLTPAEALTAVTLNAAAAIDLADKKGSIETGKDADIVIWDCPDLDFLFYRYGNNQVHKVVKRGAVI